jgi:hypothetical protein
MKGNARAAIRALRVGVVPAMCVERLTLGRAELEKKFEPYLRRLVEQGTCAPLFLLGEWGTGKSHVLSLVHASARRLELPTTGGSLDASGKALNYPQRLYPSLMERILEAGTGAIGLREIVSGWLRDEMKRKALAAFARRCQNTGLAQMLGRLCQLQSQGSAPVDDEAAWSLLLGVDLAWANYGYKRLQALERLGWVAQCFQGMGQGGLVVTLDEVETIAQLWNMRSRATAFGVLARLFRTPGLGFFLGITERFGGVVADDLYRGILDASWLSEDAHWFLSTWNNGGFERVSLPEFGAEQAEELVLTIAQLYREAYGIPGNDLSWVRTVLADWHGNPSRNTRRLIRLTVHWLDLLNPPRVWEAAMARVETGS